MILVAESTIPVPAHLEPYSPTGGMYTYFSTFAYRDEAMAEVWEEPVRGGFPDPRLWQLPGPMQVLAGLRGHWPIPPMGRLLGTRIEGNDEDNVVWTQPINGWLLSSQGVVPGGLLAVLADMALGSCITRHLPPRTPFSTSEISFNYVRPATLAGGDLTAVGRAMSIAGRLALSECDITDASGRAIAHGTARNVLGEQLPPADDAPDPDDQGAVDAYIASLAVPEEPEWELPDPYLRPPKGEVLKGEHWEDGGGLEVLRRQLDGSLAMPPVHHLTGIRPVAVSEGEANFAMPASPWLTSGFSSIQGGFLAFIAYSALASAVQTTTEPRMGHVPVDLKVNFLRPVFPDPDGRDLTAVGRVIHRGRNLSVADAEVRNPDGKMVAIARGTSMLLSDRPATAAGV
jgi:uncharacterized protein (TIGR00369 family)